jgi:outer membrane receptor protein involved in Fe transport
MAMIRGMWRSGAAVVALAVAGASQAQVAEPTTPRGDSNTAAMAVDAGDEIIVTAQKRVERIQDVPVTVSALSGERLQALGLTEYDEISAFVPGLNVQEQSANNPGFVIRGITSDTGSAQQAARVTLYYNGVDISRSRGAYQDLYDLERVEVVKGPQATLFGTAAAIGAVSVISRRPEPGVSGSALAAYGNFDQLRVEGVLNGGSEALAGRLAFAYKQYDGYIRNIAGEPGTLSQRLGLPRQDDLNGKKNLGIRGSLRARPTERTVVDFIFTYDGQDNSGTAFKSGNLPPSVADTRPTSAAELGGSPFSAAALGDEKLGLKRDVYDANLTVETQLSDAFALTFITGYREFKSNEVFDADGSGLFYLEFAEDAQGKQFSHESRVTYSSDRLRGFAGVNIFHEDGFQRVPFSTEEGTFIICSRSRLPAAVRNVLPNLACLQPNGVSPAAGFTAAATRGAFASIPYQSEFTNFGENTSYSAFADATFSPTNRIELTAGVRYVYEERTSRYSATQPNLRLPTLIGFPTSFAPLGQTTFGQVLEAEDDNEAWLPRFNALFRATDDVNLYATISKGRRSPSINLSAAAPVAGVPQASRSNIPAEIVWNYEGGAKLAVSGLSATLGAFYQTYENFGVSVFDPARGVFVPSNAGSATNWGVEAEAQFRVSEMLGLFGSVGYIDASIDNQPENGNFAGQRFRLQPKWQAAAGATFTLPVGTGLELFATPTVTHRSRIFFEVPNNPQISERAITLSNLRAGIRDADGRWQVTGYANNAFDKDYIIDAGNTGGGFGYPTFIAGQPAFYGVEVSFRF